MARVNWVLRTCGACLLWATMAVALPAQTFTTLYSLDGTDGDGPNTALVQATNGKLYGTTQGGGANTCGGYACGTVFKITLSGTLTTLQTFDYTDGIDPNGGLVQATNGELYGITSLGGANSSCDNGAGCGTVFKISPGGKLKTLYSFCSQSNCADGYFPTSALVRDTNGTLYGTTYEGGTGGNCDNNAGTGCGTVFSITPIGTLTTLYSFCSQSNCTDGAFPSGALIRGPDGNFYGTTGSGGANDGCASQYIGCGTIFQITPNGTLTTLYNFCSRVVKGVCTDGILPEGTLVQATNGTFYGTTQSGGTNGDICPFSSGCGTVFSLSVGLK
jgi:uncharacterized repeat protein (TIGR03803 family)